MQTKYLIIGSSHAGLSAAQEIRVHDQKGTLTMISMENCLPYSPTILPYIVEGKVEEKNIYLRDEKYFKDNKINFLRGKKVMQVSTKTSKVTLDDGSEIRYKKLLVATGSEPTIPPVSGLRDAPYHVLRTMEDAKKIEKALEGVQSALVMGAGLVGLHAAEALGKKGLKVVMVEMMPQILPGYFDNEASQLIQGVFIENKINFYLNNPVVKVESKNGKSKVTLKAGQNVECEFLLVSTGVKPRADFLTHSGIRVEQGIVVDNFMRTPVENVWAAGDVAQATDFFSQKKGLNAILPDAFEQGKVAGMSMAGDPQVILAFEEIGQQVALSYHGGISMNTFNFYGNRSFSVGLTLAEKKDGYEIHKKIVPEKCMYQKLVFQDDVLVGAIGINITMDPGVVMNLIRRGIHLGKAKDEFIAKPLDMSRRLMWNNWRGVVKVGA